MPPTQNPEFLRPRAVETDKTYIGANFCPGEVRLRDVYEGLPAQICVSINAVRRNVQSGACPTQELQELDLGTDYKDLLRGCLNKIAAGNCLAYPR